MSDDGTGSWILDHPVRTILTFTAATIAGGLLGVAAAAITSSEHLIAPDNALAGFGMGLGGSVLGAIAGALVLALAASSRESRP